MKAFAAILFAATIITTAVCAADYGQLPAPTPDAPFPASFLAGEYAVVPPYGALPVRIYTTPGQGPFYNVPPYRVVAPY